MTSNDTCKINNGDIKLSKWLVGNNYYALIIWYQYYML